MRCWYQLWRAPAAERSKRRKQPSVSFSNYIPLSNFWTLAWDMVVQNSTRLFDSRFFIHCCKPDICSKTKNLKGSWALVARYEITKTIRNVEFSRKSHPIASYHQWFCHFPTTADLVELQVHIWGELGTRILPYFFAQMPRKFGSPTRQFQTSFDCDKMTDFLRLPSTVTTG